MTNRSPIAECSPHWHVFKNDPANTEDTRCSCGKQRIGDTAEPLRSVLLNQTAQNEPAAG